MSLFRRRQPLHVQLAREAGMSLGDDPSGAPWDTTGIHGLHRARQWDAVVAVRTPELEGGEARFVALSDGVLVVEDGPDDVEPLARAVETELAPPYRAEAVRRDADLWAVAAKSIDIVPLPGVSGEELELVSRGAERTLVVDGERSFGTIAALERPDHVVRARRIDGELWEVEVDPL